MYQGHNNWDEDKWNIHSNKGSYAGQGSDKSQDQIDYHKNDSYSSSNAGYGSSDNPEDKFKDDYKSSQKEEEEEKEKEKEDEEKEKNIVDTVEEEQKNKQQEDEEETEFEALTREIKPPPGFDAKNKPVKKKKNKSIEEAINKAMKEEKETVFVD